MRKGQLLESAVCKLFEFYKSKNIHCQQNSPKQTKDGKYVEKHGFDFQVFYADTFYAFDAKECHSRSISITQFKPHQIQALSDVYRQGGEAFFLVYYFVHGCFVRFDIKNVLARMERKQRSFLPDDGVVLPNLDFLELGEKKWKK